MIPTLKAIKQGFQGEDGGFVFKFGEGYELWLERLICDDQWYLALYKDQELLLPNKVVVKLGKKEDTVENEPRSIGQNSQQEKQQADSV